MKFIFPNVELRLTIETERRKAINIHLLFSPDDHDHEMQIERALTALVFVYAGNKFRCTPTDLALLGKTVDPSQTEDRCALAKGAEQFKVTLDQLRGLFDDKWVRENCLVAVAAAEGDGTSGLKKDGSFLALRREIERFSHMVFSSKPSDREYWLGDKPGFGLEYMDENYGGPKPCLHGCDAHTLDETLAPDGDRFCWIRAGLSFEGLRQTLVEPGLRVAIGPQPPPGPSEYDYVRRVDVTGAPWLSTTSVELNDGLVAIVGPKGSGKTALADIIARGCGAIVDSEASFLRKAQEHLAGAKVQLTWADGNVAEKALRDEATWAEEPRVRYLSQQFVEQLCSSDGLGRALVEEIESVVFLAIDEADRLGATNFNELRQTSLEDIESLRREYSDAIRNLSRDISAEELLKEQLPHKRAALKRLEERIAAETRELHRLVPKDKTAQGARLLDLQKACQLAEGKVQNLKLQKKSLGELADHVRLLRSKREQEHSALMTRYVCSGLSGEEWDAFKLTFTGDVAAIIRRVEARVDDGIRVATSGVPGATCHPDDLSRWHLDALRTERDRLQRETGVEKEKAQKYKVLQQSMSTAGAERERTKKEIEHAEAADKRRRDLLEKRRGCYAEVFDTLEREQQILEGLYAPLGSYLKEDRGVAKLEFFVHRRIDLAAWVERGEGLLDLRNAGAFHGKGALETAARESLLSAWRSGGKAEVANAMQQFLERHASSLRRGMAAHATVAQVAEWLFSTDHVSLEYGIRYEGVQIERLSPGTRGIVLLLLYLAVDRWDTRPLVIDQPEENLDPQSVYDELVAYFRSARNRRQVILVTHNPNLVVNADADQVIVATAERLPGGGLPTIRYASGGLEDRVTRTSVCRILEGGERAFLQRDRRYALSRTPNATVARGTGGESKTSAGPVAHDSPPTTS
ncbi:MAG: AAA family ATPase [Candidatus Brocadiia bacterium]